MSDKKVPFHVQVREELKKQRESGTKKSEQPRMRVPKKKSGGGISMERVDVFKLLTAVLLAIVIVLFILTIILSNNVKDLSKKVNAINGGDIVSSDTSQLESDIASMQDDLAKIKLDVNKLEGDMGVVQGEIDILNDGSSGTNTGNNTGNNDNTGSNDNTGDNTGTNDNSDMPVVERDGNQYYVYTAVQGDTYWGIATKIMGEGAKYVMILEANGLSKDDTIQIGDELFVPKLD